MTARSESNTPVREQETPVESCAFGKKDKARMHMEGLCESDTPVVARGGERATPAVDYVVSLR
jgi:hypothetical protein